MDSSKGPCLISVLIGQGKIKDLEDVFTYLDPTIVQVQSGIEPERFAAFRQHRGEMLVTEIHRLAEAIGISRPELIDLLVPGQAPGG